jgi:cellulose biosynthesis protein BcsQ
MSTIQAVLSTIIIAILGRKGGIGKTTIATNLAAALARQGKRVALIETDGQGDSTFSVGLPYANDFASLILDDAEWNEVLQPIPDDFAGENLDLWILRAHDAQLNVERDLNTSARIVERIKELKGYYDYVIIDAGPNLAETHIGLYYAASHIILPTLVESKAINAVGRMFNYLDQAAATSVVPVAKVLGIQPNRFDARHRIQHRLLGYIDGLYLEKAPIFEPLQNLAVWEYASTYNVSIYQMAGSHAGRARKQFQPLVDAALALHIQNQEKNASWLTK